MQSLHDGSLPGSHHRGAWTWGQDKNTSVVFGMAAVAFDRGAIEHLVPLQEIPKLLAQFMAKLGRGSKAKAA